LVIATGAIATDWLGSIASSFPQAALFACEVDLAPFGWVCIVIGGRRIEIRTLVIGKSESSKLHDWLITAFFDGHYN
jgi:hypothetical protein